MDEVIYNRNIEALRATQLGLYNILKEVEIDKHDEFEVIKGPRGHNVLKVKKDDGKYINYNSAYDPYREASDLLKSIDFEVNRCLIVGVGVGLGYHLKEAVDKLNEKSIILAVEKNKGILKNLFYYTDFSQAILDKKIFFVVGDFDDEALAKQIISWMQTLILNIASIQPLILNISDINYIRYSKEVLKMVRDARSLCAFCMGNDIDDTLLGFDNMLKNLPHIIRNPGLNQLLENYKDAYRGKPAIVIASGPSLDKNIHLLKEAKGKALLLACDGSMDSLKKHGIIPDAVSSVERIMATYECFYKDKVMPDESVLVAPAVVRPEIFQSFSTKTLSLFKTELMADWFNKMVYNKGSVWSGASVAHQLVGFAKALGADPIILIGQDLAYSSDGVSHTSEASVKEKVDLSNVKLYVKDIYGNDVPTTRPWKYFLEIYENAIAQMNLNIIDATEGGAYIKGTKLMTLREVIDTYCVDEVPNLRYLVDSLDVSEDFIKKAYKNVFKSTIKIAKMYCLIKKRSEKSLKLNEEAKKLLDEGITTDEELDQVYDAMDYTEKRVVRYITRNNRLYTFFMYKIMTTIVAVNQLGTEITLDVLSKNLDIHRDLLGALVHFSTKAVDTFRTNFKDIKEQAAKVFSQEELDNIVFPEWD
ncbi:MAG: DUF115 domain-containing protein [Clostridia bacterium]|nr:DUF115 domain-containing protein [Clostridia bacterium]